MKFPVLAKLEWRTERIPFFTLTMMNTEFPTDLESIIERVDAIDPIRYAKTRNFIDGAVTRLSPYISRGVISSRFVLDRVLARGYEPRSIEKFIQELAWREYYQRVWQVKGDEINRDLRFRQQGVENDSMPVGIINANTGIDAVDRGIEGLYKTGYMHNHVRMYTASMACNIGRSHWNTPARWLYYHLLDGDWASNALSWQWVAGSASSKKYFANQENIDRYCATRQRGTFLDVDYADFESIPVPPELSALETPELRTGLTFGKDITFDPSLPTLIYNSYNLDPSWKPDVSANRVLLLEPSHFSRYPVSDKVIDFIVSLGNNITGLQIYAGEFSEFRERYSPSKVFYKEHPLNRHYVGIEESQDWMFTVTGYFPSFFGYWKKCERELFRSPKTFEYAT